jgi:hypothetical protein
MALGLCETLVVSIFSGAVGAVIGPHILGYA